MSEEVVEILITGPGMPEDTIDKLKERSDAKNILFIGNGTEEVPLELITKELQEKDIASSVRIDINAHGGLLNPKEHPKQHAIELQKESGIPIKECLTQVAEALKKQSGNEKLRCEFHLWACYGGAADKDTHVLGEGNTLTTHVNSKNPSLIDLDGSLMISSIENYLKNPDRPALERFVDEIKYAPQPTTFNLNTTPEPEGTITLKGARYLKSGGLKEIVNASDNTDFIQAFQAVISSDIEEIMKSDDFIKARKYEKFEVPKKIELDPEKTKKQALDMISHWLYVNPSNIISRDYELLEKCLSNIIKCSVDLNGPTKEATSFLYIAAQKGHSEAVKILLEKGAKVDQVGKDGTTPLWIAPQNGHYEAVQELVVSGADVNKANEDGNYSIILI